MIRIDVGMSTARWCTLFDVPERTWRRWQAKARAGAKPKGPWPRPAPATALDVARTHALAHPVWGHRKVWAMVRHDGHVVSEATILRVLRDEGLLLPAQYQRERRRLAERRKAEFAAEPTGPNQVWQLDFTCVRDHQRWHLADRRLPGLLVQVRAPVACVTDRQQVRCDRRGRAGARGLRGVDRPAAGRGCRVDENTGEIIPAVTIVTDNGGPFRSARFEAFIAAHPELAHVRTRINTPGQVIDIDARRGEGHAKTGPNR